MNLVKVRETITKIDNAVYTLIAWICGFLVLAMVIFNCIGLSARYFFTIPVAWVNDLSLLCLLTNTLLGASVAWAKGQHLVLDLFDRLYPERVKRFFWWASQLIMIAAGVKMIQLADYNAQLYKGMTLSLLGYDESLKCRIIGVGGILLLMAAVFKVAENVLALFIKEKEER